MPELHGFAVNLSGQTASDPGFVEFVREHFQRTGIDPSWVSFEVTETAAVADLSSSAGIVRELKALGCKVALDDFGSGLASYSYLKELPVDWLKIDGVFVRKIAADREDLAMPKSSSASKTLESTTRKVSSSHPRFCWIVCCKPLTTACAPRPNKDLSRR